MTIISIFRSFSCAPKSHLPLHSFSPSLFCSFLKDVLGTFSFLAPYIKQDLVMVSWNQGEKTCNPFVYMVYLKFIGQTLWLKQTHLIMQGPLPRLLSPSGEESVHCFSWVYWNNTTPLSSSLIPVGISFQSVLHFV